MENRILSHEELQKNISDLENKPESGYLYHNGYVYYSSNRPGASDATGWISGGEVFKRVKDDGSEITVFDKTYNKSASTASSSHTYNYGTPKLADGYVHFSIRYSSRSDWGDDSEQYAYKVKDDGISDLE